MEFPTKDTSYSQGHFIPVVWSYLAKTDAKIEVHKTYVSPSLWLNGNPIDTKTKTEPQVRLFLGITWVIEISTQTGTHMRDHTLQHQDNTAIYKPTLTKVFPKRPNTASWRIFDRVISKITEPDKTTIKQGYTLGKWAKNHIIIGLWNAYINPTRTTAWVRQENSTWNQCSINRTYVKYQRTIKDFNPTMNHTPFRIDMISTDTQQYTLTIKIHYPAETMGIYPESPWGIQLTQQPKRMQDLLEYVTFERINIIIGELESSPHLLMVSNGSGKTKSMAFGWVLSTPGGHRLAHIGGTFPAGKGKLPQDRKNTSKNCRATPYEQNLYLCLPAKTARYFFLILTKSLP